MTQKTDPQIKDETSRQRAYDESATTPEQGDNPPPKRIAAFCAMTARLVPRLKEAKV